MVFASSLLQRLFVVVVAVVVVVIVVVFLAHSFVVVLSDLALAVSVVRSNEIS